MNRRTKTIIERVAVVLILVAAVILCSTYVLGPALGFTDQFQLGDDGGFHIGRIQTLADDIETGQFPDKMYMSMSAGYGYPAGIMYPDFFLYPFAFLRILGLPLLWTVVVFMLCLNAATAVVAYFCAKSFLKSRQIACVFSLLWTVSPYRLYCIFTRMAWGELLAMIFLPLIIVCFYNIFTFDKFGAEKIERKQWIGLAIGVAGTINSHVLTAALVGAFSAIPVIAILIVKRSRQCLLAILKAAALCLGLSLFFLVPFIDYFITYKSGMATGDMSLWFILSSPNRENYFSFNDQFRQGWAFYIAFIIWPALCIAKTKKAIYKNIKVFGWLMFAFAALFLLIAKSEPLWSLGDQGIPVVSQVIMKLASVQYPWRFYGPMVICLIFLLAICLFVLKRYANGCKNVEFDDTGKLSDYVNRWPKVVMEAVMVAVVAFSIFVAATYTNNTSRLNFVNVNDYFSNYVPEADDLYLPYYDMYNKDSAFLNDWWPLQERLDHQNKNVEFSNAKQVGTQITMHVQNNSAQNQQIDIPLVAYPYVRVFDVNTGAEFTAVEDWWSSFINITLPPNYSGDLVCGFVKPLYWTMAECASLVIAVALISYLIATRKSKNNISKNS